MLDKLNGCSLGKIGNLVLDITEDDPFEKTPISR